jgi:hypothetical protein
MDMTKHGIPALALALLASLELAGAASAQTPVGEGSFHGARLLKVKNCGRSAGPVSFDFAIDAGGAWTLDTGSNLYTGTASGNRRVARLVPDASSLATLESVLESGAGALCGEPVDLSSLHPLAVLKVSKRQTRARLFARVGASAETATRHGRAVFKVRTRGAWMPAPAE